MAKSIADAVELTQSAAILVKQLDTNHPVFASYGDIDIGDTGRRLADTAAYIARCTSVDAWTLNIDRGSDFGSLFAQWASITTKPMALGEFGVDAFHATELTNPNPPGSVNEQEQRDWDLGLWEDLYPNLSANNPAKVAAGGFVFSWNDQWWEIAPAVSQQTGRPRLAYAGLQAVFDPSYVPPVKATRTVTNLSDAGPGSLLQALADARAGDTIDFAVTGMIALSSRPLVIARRLTIGHSSAASLVITRVAGAPDFRILDITGGPVVISGVTIAGGRSPDFGGGIRNAATLVLSACAVSGNFAGTLGDERGQGSGIWNSGTLTVQDSAFAGNTSTGNGGAIGSTGNLVAIHGMVFCFGLTGNG